jgi:hypothetical protein
VAEQVAAADGTRASLSLAACNSAYILCWKGKPYSVKMFWAGSRLQAPSLRSLRLPPLSSGVRPQTGMIMHFLIGFALLFAIYFPEVAFAKSKASCKGNNEVVADCFEFHGRLACYNGNPSVRIWRIGSRRILGVEPDERPIIPDNIAKYVDFGNYIYADFLVCPFETERSGWMQRVCIETASNVVIEHYDEKTKTTKTFRLRDH